MIAIMLNTFITQLQTIPGGKELHLPARAFLFHQGDTVESLFLVLTGEVRLVRHQPDGSSITLQRAKPGGLLAEASLYSVRYHCHAVTQQASCVYSLPRQAMFVHLQTNHEFAYDWMNYLAQEVQQARFRSELLSLKTVAARLDAWLNWQGGRLPAKGEWKALAEQLSVSPEALYREIAKQMALAPK